MNIRAILESKLDSETKVKLGEANLAKLSEITLEDDVAESIKAALLSLTEAENSPAIVGKNKDKWHKETLKGFMDSIDSTTSDHLSVLGEEVPTDTKSKNKAILSAYKTKVDTLSQELATLKKDGVSDADSKALVQAKEAEIADLKKNYVPSETIKVVKDENDDLKRELESFKKASIKEKITNSAIKSGILIDLNPELVDDVVYGAAKKYIEKSTFGNEKAKVKLMLDKATKQLVIRNASDESMSIVVDGSILTVDKLIKDALVEFGLNKKSENDNPKEFQFKNQDNKKVEVLDTKYF
jgi:hypothetical protein